MAPLKTKLKEIRQELKLTQTEFAEVIGVRQATISDWERGIKLPSRLAKRSIEMLYHKKTKKSISL